MVDLRGSEFGCRKTRGFIAVVRWRWAAKGRCRPPPVACASSSRKRHAHSGQKVQKYVPNHPTTPPENQVITTDPTNILIRTLNLRKKKGGKGKKVRV